MGSGLAVPVIGMGRLLHRRASCLGGLLALFGCANVNARYDAGQQALSSGAWQRATEELNRFSDDADCGTDPRCKQVRVDLAECRLRLGDPTAAFFALEAERQAVPSGTQLYARLERLQREAQDTLATRLPKATGEGTLSVTFTSKVHDRVVFRQAQF